MRGIFSDIYLNAFFGAISDRQNEYKIKKMREDNGITVQDGYDGVEQLNIPHIYTSINVSNTYFCCLDKHGFNHIYNQEGVKLFASEKHVYCGENRFLVKHHKDKGYALFNDADILTDYMFEPYGSNKYNDAGYLLVHDIFESYNTSVIDLLGELVYEGDKFDSIYTYGVVVADKKGYFNLLTKEYICGKGCTNIYIDEYIFVNIDRNCVYQIKKSDGTFVIHGKEDESKKPLTEAQQKEKDDEKAKLVAESKSKQKALDLERKIWVDLGRNDLCLCGSKKKFKNCCINSWEQHLTK